MNGMLELWICAKCNKNFSYKKSLPYQGNKASPSYGQRILPKLETLADNDRKNKKYESSNRIIEKTLTCTECIDLVEKDYSISSKYVTLISLPKTISKTKAIRDSIIKSINCRYKNYNPKKRRITNYTNLKYNLEFLENPFAIVLTLSFTIIAPIKDNNSVHLIFTKETAGNLRKGEAFYEYCRKFLSAYVLETIYHYFNPDESIDDDEDE